MKDVPPRALILRGLSGCVGDSGGPLLAAASGAVLGIYSLQRAHDCADPAALHQLVHVAPFQNLIDEAFAAAHAQPLGEPPAEPTPEPDAGAKPDANGEPDASSGAGAANDAGAGPTAAAGSGPRETAPRSSSCGFARSPAADPTVLLLALLAPVLKRRSGARRRATRHAG